MRDVLRRFVISLFALLIAMATGICNLMYGWGLEPKNWWIIIGLSFFGYTISQTLVELTKDK